MRNISDKICRENETRILCSVTFFPENRAVYEIMWKNIVQPEEPQMSVWCMHMVGWIPKVTYTHSEYVILIACLGFLILFR